MLYLVIVEIINFCNLKCKHCYDKFENNEIMALKDFEKIAKLLSDYGCNTIRISGGEPTLVGERIFEYAKIALRYIKNVELTTNGTVINNFDDEDWKLFSNIQISLDGTEGIHDSVRGKGNFKKAYEALIGLKSKGNKVSVMMTVGKHNLHDIEGLNSILSEYNIPLYFERITGTGRASQFEELTSIETKTLLEKVKILNLKTTDPLHVFFDEERRTYLNNNCVMGGCSAGITAICIDTKLEVFPCPRLRISCGNLKKMSLDSILKSSIIQSLQNRDMLEGKCRECDERWICGGCRASAYVTGENYLAEDKGCFINV